MALCPGLPGWAGTRRNTHPPTILIIIQCLSASSIYHDPWHPPCSNYVLDNLFCTTSLHVLFGLPLGLKPCTSYSIHFFIQSMSSFRNTCPYHLNLFCYSISIMSSIPSLSLNSLLGTLSFTLTLHIHLTILCSLKCHLIFLSWQARNKVISNKVSIWKFFSKCVSFSVYFYGTMQLC